MIDDVYCVQRSLLGELWPISKWGNLRQKQLYGTLLSCIKLNNNYRNSQKISKYRMLRDFVYVEERKQLCYYQSLQGHGEHLLRWILCPTCPQGCPSNITEKLFRESASEISTGRAETTERLDKLKVAFRCWIAFEESFELTCLRFIFRFESRFWIWKNWQTNCDQQSELNRRCLNIGDAQDIHHFLIWVRQ